MDLKLIKDKVCPTCGERVVSESIRSYHCNGQGFESRTFKCGCELNWSPNGERLEVAKGCPNSKEEKERKSRIEKVMAEIALIIDKSDLTEKEKSYVVSYFPYDYVRLNDFLKKIRIV